MEDKVIVVLNTKETDAEIESLRTEFANIMKEVEILGQQATEKRTRLVEIQGAIKTLEKVKAKAIKKKAE